MIVCRSERDKSSSLAVLDIFGFEVSCASTMSILLCFVNAPTNFEEKLSFLEPLVKAMSEYA